MRSILILILAVFYGSCGRIIINTVDVIDLLDSPISEFTKLSDIGTDVKYFPLQDKKEDNSILIPLAKGISKLNEIKCSQFINEFEYIQLETNNKCLIDNNPKALILKDYILIYQIKYCFVFDRKTGKFLYELGKYGKGPGEYQNSLLTYDINRSIIYSSGWKNNMMMFSLAGKYLGSFPIPYQIGGFDNPSLMFLFSSLPDSRILGYSANHNGSEKKLLTVIDQKGEAIKVFSNRNIFPKQKMVIDLLEVNFYQLNNKTYFKERYNDTLFQVTEKELIPHIIFSMDKYTVPYSSKWWSIEERKKAKYIAITRVFENKAYVILKAFKQSIEYVGLFNKGLNELLVNEIKSGLPNDVDNFIPFDPTFMDNEGNLYAIVNPTEIINWFKDNHAKFNFLPEKTKKLQTMSMEMNPVIMIGKTKFK